jgi:hypothetical protein
MTAHAASSEKETSFALLVRPSANSMLVARPVFQTIISAAVEDNNNQIQEYSN